MQLRLRTKFTLVMTSLVLLVVAVLSGVFFAQLLEQVLHETEERTKDLAQNTFRQVEGAVVQARERGWRPDSNSAEDMTDYVRYALQSSDGLRAHLASASQNPIIYDVSVTTGNGLILISTHESSEGKDILRRDPLSQLVHRNFLHQANILRRSPKEYDQLFPFTVGNQPYQIHVIISTALLLNEISSSLRTAGTIALMSLAISALLAAIVSGVTLAPLRDITAQLDRISAGKFDAPARGTRNPEGTGDEFRMVSQKISQVEQQLRGVHEIFSTMRENMNSVMAGLEDGLLLFTRDARAVMISPAAEKFLGAPAGHFLGRRLTDIFPHGHPLRDALRIEGDQLSEVAAETDLETTEGSRRVGISVQAIQEDGERMGALLTLRDLDSLESINTQLQVSERLAALGRITAGVAHEVKNPLNSMRLWLENLKELLPPGKNSPSRQAVQVLDKEIDRLDAVVKRFLDFTRPMDIHLEATQLAELLKEVLEIAKPQLEKSNIQLAQLLPIDVPEVYVDRALLKQAVLNLVLNATEAMPSGGQLHLVLSRRGEMAEITVGDTGKGISPEDRTKIFQLFFTTRPGGSGIGLATTFRIVQLHNGSIDFTSEVGRGTTFRIELPLAA